MGCSCCEKKISEDYCEAVDYGYETVDNSQNI